MRVQKLSARIARIPLYAEPLAEFFEKWQTRGDLINFSITRDDQSTPIKKASQPGEKPGPKKTDEKES